ncbi:hypothetical protein KR018_000855, partial [Drosophila ironensis]
KFEFTNTKCISTDPNFGYFEYCHLKSVNRSYKYLSAKYRIAKKPVTSVKVTIALLKRFNGYKPFLYNVTVDACKFMKNPKAYPINNYFYNYIASCSNMNHSCPYDHDIILDKVTIANVNHRATNVLPFPEGEYLLEIHWSAYDIVRAVTKFYGVLS